MSTSISLKKVSVWPHTEPFFKLMDVLKLKDLLNINALKLYYKYLHGTLPSYLYSFNIATQDENHFYNTRQSNQIRTNRTRTHFADKRLQIYLLSIINLVPITLLQKLLLAVSMDSRPNVKRYLIDNYSNACSIPNCYVCQRARQLLFLKYDMASFLTFYTIPNPSVYDYFS